MDVKWTTGKKGDAKEARRKQVLGYRNTFDDLKEILVTLQNDVGIPDYTSPSWAFEQAHSNGFNQALERVINLITIKDKDA